ncbi:MAG: hypothetical protein HRU31_00875 [Rhodobacteraceae bacterium]|nr:hypothetical protein [Paracoccaceae bacterium]
MPVKFNATVDGVNDVPRPSGSSSVDFDDGRINYYSAFEDSDDLVARFRLEGADWKIRLFRVSADENQGFTNTTIIKDQDNASGRRIDFLSLGENSEVDLKSTRVQYIEGWEGTEHDISLGSEFTNYINLGAATNRVTVGTGDVGNVSIYDGRLILKIDQGGSVKFVDGDDKNDIVNLSQGRIDALRLSEGADKVTVSSTGRIDYVEAFNGKKDFILSGEGRIGKIDTGDGNKLTTVKLSNNARINNLENFQAGLDLDLAGNARVGTLRSGDTTRVTDVELKGNAQIGAMEHYDGDSDISIKGNARINSLNAGEGDINITATGNGRIGSTQLNEGNHTIITDDGYFSIMEIWRGKVDLTIGQGGAGSIRIDSDAVNSHKAKFDGYVESLHISDRNDDDSDDQSINLVIGQEGSGKIETGNGNDRVTVKGYVNFLSTRDGDDRVVINTNEGSERVNLGDGDDTILVSKFAGDRGILIAGRGGSDTIDFSLYGKSAVVFDLDTGGAYPKSRCEEWQS